MPLNHVFGAHQLRAPFNPDYVHFEDFDADRALNNTAATARYTWTAAGTGASVPTAIADGAGGQVVVASGLAANSSVQFQQIAEPVKLTAGARVVAGVRAKLAATTSLATCFGLGITDTTTFDGSSAFSTDGVWLIKEGADANLDLATAFNAASYAAYSRNDSLIALTASWWTLLLELHMDPTTSGTGRVVVHAGDGPRGVEFMKVYDAVRTDLCYDEELALTWVTATTAGSQQTATLDWIGVATAGARATS